MDEVVSKAVEVLLAAGWKGIAAALIVAVLYALLRVYVPKAKLGPGTPQAVVDENGPQPDGEPLPTDQQNPGGGPGGGSG